MLKVDGWCRIEGNLIPVADRNYGTLLNIANKDIYYGNVELQLINPTNLVNGVRYKVIPFSTYGFNTINQVDSNYAIANTIINNQKFVDGSDYYTKPFVITESSVILYDDGGAQNALNRTLIVLVDKYATAKIKAITAQYDGPSVAMGEAYDHDDLIVTAIYSDGTESRILAGGYTVSGNTVETVGSNVYTVTVTYGDNSWSATFSIVGIKKITGINARYDGINIALNHSPQRKNIIVTALYSDGSSSAVTDWIYSDGDIITETNLGVLDIFYQGFSTNVAIPYYAVTPSKLIAFYNGPNVEVGKDFLLEYLTVKIYYVSGDGLNNYYETLVDGSYTVSTTAITYEGNNNIQISYPTEFGTLTTTFVVFGFKPEKEIVYITAEYTGAPVLQGKAYNVEKIICKVYYSDNSVSTIKNFTVNNTTVQNVGNNEFVLYYEEKYSTFNVTGIENDSTTENGYIPTKVDLKYPEATLVNHRFRGPMESKKFDEYNQFVRENVITLFNIYNNLELQFKNMNENILKSGNIKMLTLNECQRISDSIHEWKGKPELFN